MDAGPVTLTVTFLSPVTPNDMLRQSMPITYIDVAVKSNDGNKHDVQLYTDISAEWVSGDRSQVAQWDYGVIGNSSSSLRKRAPEAEPTMFMNEAELGMLRAEPSFFMNEAEERRRRECDSTTTSAVSQASVTTSVQESHNATDLTPTATSISDQSTTTIVDKVVSSTSVFATANITASDTSANTTSITITSTAFSTSTSANTSATASSTSAANGIAYHKVWRQLQQEFSEESQQASWGYWYYATKSVAGLTYQSGADIDVRGQFTTSGGLNNTNDTDFRAISDDWPVFAYAVDLGSVGSESVSTVFTLNLAQKNAIQFEGADGIESLQSYWTNTHSDDLSALSFFYNDYQEVVTMTTDLDNKIASDSKAISSDYATLTTLIVRQAFNSLAVVGNGTSPYVFLKEISSDGDVQTVDVIFPAMPIFVYLNPDILKNLLIPIFIYQEAGHFTQGSYAPHDLGYYPNATAAGTETQPLEECGNMLIMSLIYAQRSGDTDFLSQHYNTLNQWTQYLVNESLIPSNQISTDDFAGSLANQTNLALKGMIGIQAMSIIANMTGHAADGANYAQTAASFIAQWQNLGIAHDASPPHTTLAYGQNDTHGLLYNLYADALLQTNLVPVEIYQMQSNFYPTVADTYGSPLDTRHNYTKSDWEIFCAAIADTNTSTWLISDIAKWINETPTNTPVTDLYQADSGDFAQGTGHFLDRPVVGGWFAPLALNQTGIPVR
ncbi:hypothetical protein LTR78_003345 [Recurvomyces mirabilis]|uniref:Glutaminase n=1 Tax=Recurvomyces mirabilis TaxID=574656 RepID=A0AAE0WRA8_9PEZI|nr:hypothetical protein LTR78_003345 [Recurvomyces mirabilis]KAK5154619.1 hypothetical protein LTS14_006757 [Recurvomyces mirabilis]